MNLSEQKRALDCAIKAARLAGETMRKNLRLPKKINDQTRHDIKLELDVRCQKLIQQTLHRDFPNVGFLGEEGLSETENSDLRWVVDPIDGTVNFTCEIPHACVSIALQIKRQKLGVRSREKSAYETLVGAVYDPFCDEMFTAIRGQKAKLNGDVISVSKHNRLEQSIVAMGFGKSKDSIQQSMDFFTDVMPRVRKIRMMGAAALAMVYVASGRFDAYIESSVRIWDIAAGGLILECAGGEFWHQPAGGEHEFRILANNGLVRRKLQRLGRR
jgi:myo-inositol-1(or 4)-monophosphatase